MCYDLDSKSKAHSEGRREYMMKFFISSKYCMQKYQQNNLQN